MMVWILVHLADGSGPHLMDMMIIIPLMMVVMMVVMMMTMVMMKVKMMVMMMVVMIVMMVMMMTRMAFLSQISRKDELPTLI